MIELLQGGIAVGVVMTIALVGMSVAGGFEQRRDYDFGPAMSALVAVAMGAASVAVLLVYWAVGWLMTHVSIELL